MSDPAVVINLLGVDEGGEVAKSSEALRLLIGLEYNAQVEAFSLASWLPEATPFDCLMMLLEQCHDAGIDEVTILTDMREDGWRNLWLQAMSTYGIKLKRVIPATISHYCW
jgi:hypothetical protein